MPSKTALITGALGQDGQLLGELLLRAGYQVVGLVAPGRIPPRKGPPSAINFVAADLSDATMVRSILEKWQPEEIYHLAACHHSSQDKSISSVLATKETMLASNFLSTKTLAFAVIATQVPCHLVFAASSQMFTASERCHEITETTPRKPSTFYGHTKSWSVELIEFLRSESHLRASSAILFNHESPLRSTQFVSRKITRAAAETKLGKQTTLHLSNVGSRVDWCSARDVVSAMHLMASARDGCDYVIASGQLHTIVDLLDVAFSHVDLDWREFTTYEIAHETPALQGNSSLLRETLGWKQTITFEQMITEMVDHDLTSIRAGKSG